MHSLLLESNDTRTFMAQSVAVADSHLIRARKRRQTSTNDEGGREENRPDKGEDQNNSTLFIRFYEWGCSALGWTELSLLFFFLWADLPHSTPFFISPSPLFRWLQLPCRRPGWSQVSASPSTEDDSHGCEEPADSSFLPNAYAQSEGQRKQQQQQPGRHKSIPAPECECECECGWRERRSRSIALRYPHFRVPVPAVNAPLAQNPRAR